MQIGAVNRVLMIEKIYKANRQTGEKFGCYHHCVLQHTDR